MCSTLNSNIEVLTINANSLRSNHKKIHLYNLLNKNKPDFALIQETRLIASDKLNFQNYNFFRSDCLIFPGTAVAIKSQ